MTGDREFATAIREIMKHAKRRDGRPQTGEEIEEAGFRMYQHIVDWCAGRAETQSGTPRLDSEDAVKALLQRVRSGRA